MKALTIFLLVLWAAVTPAFAADVPTLLYLSARDCPTCREFEAAEKPIFDASPEAKKVQLRELSRATLMRPMVDADWPADLKFVPKAAKILRWTPGFVVLSGDKVVLVAYGRDQWRELVVPKLAELTK